MRCDLSGTGNGLPERRGFFAPSSPCQEFGQRHGGLTRRLGRDGFAIEPLGVLVLAAALGGPALDVGLRPRCVGRLRQRIVELASDQRACHGGTTSAGAIDGWGCSRADGRRDDAGNSEGGILRRRHRGVQAHSRDEESDAGAYGPHRGAG